MYQLSIKEKKNLSAMRNGIIKKMYYLLKEREEVIKGERGN